MMSEFDQKLKYKLLANCSKEKLVDLILELRREILNLYNSDMVLVMEKIANINHMVIKADEDESKK